MSLKHPPRAKPLLIAAAVALLAHLALASLWLSANRPVEVQAASSPGLQTEPAGQGDSENATRSTSPVAADVGDARPAEAVATPVPAPMEAPAGAMTTPAKPAPLAAGPSSRLWVPNRLPRLPRADARAAMPLRAAPLVRPGPALTKTAPAPARPVAAGSTSAADSPATLAAYAKAVRAHLARYIKELPADAKGEARVQFTVDPDGRVRDVQLVKASGHAGLDALTRALPEQAQPLPTPGGKAVRIEIPVQAAP